MADTALVIVDLETTGLDVDQVALLEIGMIAIDRTFKVIDTFESLVGNAASLYEMRRIESIANGHYHTEIPLSQEVEEGAAWVYRHHTESGLWQRVMTAAHQKELPTPADVSEDAQAWLTGVGGVGLPMGGSNVANYDRPILRRWLPSLEKQFHYRNVDISSVKEFIRAFGPEGYYDQLRDRLHPKQLHRTLADCLDTINEAQLYAQELLPDELPPT